MRSLVRRIKYSLSSRKGETLIEAIVSIVILAILLSTITLMISTSRRLTANSMIEAREMQEDVLNPVYLGDYTGTPVAVTISGTLVSPTTGLDTGVIVINNVTHSVIRYIDADNPDIIAFYPTTGGGGP